MTVAAGLDVGRTKIRCAFTIDWLGFDVARAFRRVASARLESDVRAAALAEARHGAARGVSEPWLYVSGRDGHLVLARGRRRAVFGRPRQRAGRGRAARRTASRATSAWFIYS
jgi:hypothetical protein